MSRRTTYAPTVRNADFFGALTRHAGAMRDRRVPRGGAQIDPTRRPGCPECGDYHDPDDACGPLADAD